MHGTEIGCAIGASTLDDGRPASRQIRPAKPRRYAEQAPVRRPWRRPDVWRFNAIAALTIIVGLVIGIWVVQISDPLLALLTSANLALCAIGIVRALGAGRTRPLNLLFFVFFLAWIAIPSAYQLSHHMASRDDNAITYNLQITVAAQLMTGIALASFLLGGWWADRFPRRPRSPSAAESLGQADPASGKLRLLFELAFVIVLLPLAIKSAGGISGLFSSRDALMQVRDTAGLDPSGGAGTGFISILPGSLALAVAYTYIARRRRLRDAAAEADIPTATITATAITTRSRRSSRIRDASVLVILAICMSVLYNNPLVRTRYVALTAIVALLLMRYPLKSARAGVIAVLVILVGLFTLYPLANTFRGNKYINAETHVGLAQLAGPDFDGFQQVANTIIYVQQHGHTQGADTASAALFFVPRSIWASKARPGGILVAANRNYSFTDLSEPIHAEIYLDFGYAGMIVFMAAWGFGWRRLDALYLSQPTIGLCALVPYLAVAQLGFIRGPLNSLAPVYLPTLLLLIINLRAAPQRSRKVASVAQPAVRRLLPAGSQ